MIVYFDESYPPKRSEIILGALFLSDKAHRILHNKFAKIKKTHNFSGEIKYSEITSLKSLTVAKEIVTEYFALAYPYFRVCVLPQSKTKLSGMSTERLQDKRLAVYLDGAMKLILNNLPSTTHKTKVYMDEETRVYATDFMDRLLIARPSSGAIIELVQQVRSSDESRRLVQLCDLLTGAVKQGLYPTATKAGKFKHEFGEHVLSLLGVANFGKTYWQKFSTHAAAVKKHPKMTISHWKIPKGLYLNKK